MSYSWHEGGRSVRLSAEADAVLLRDANHVLSLDLWVVRQLKTASHPPSADRCCLLLRTLTEAAARQRKACCIEVDQEARVLVYEP